MADRLQARPRLRQMLRVEIDPYQASGGTEAMQNLRSMSAPADSAIHDAFARLWGQRRQHFFEHDRAMFPRRRTSFAMHLGRRPCWNDLSPAAAISIATFCALTHWHSRDASITLRFSARCAGTAMIRLQCPKCETKLGVDDSKAGGVAVCPDCGQKFRIPGKPAASASAGAFCAKRSSKSSSPGSDSRHQTAPPAHSKPASMARTRRITGKPVR